MKLELVASDGSVSFLHQVSFPSTGGWQNWTTTRDRVYLEEGEHHLRMTIMAPLFNMNWFEFSYRSTGIENQSLESLKLKLYPNPSDGIMYLEGTLENPFSGQIQVFDLLGRVVATREIHASGMFRETLQLDHLSSGNYLLVLRGGAGAVLARELLLIAE